MVSKRLVAFFTFALALSACGRFSHSRESATSSPATLRADAGRGRAVYTTQCAACHGVSGANGPVGPSLVKVKKRLSAAQVEAIVRDPDPPMPKLYPGTLSDRDVKDVSAYVESL